MFPSDTDYDTKVTLETEATPVDDDMPFHLLLTGDWSGKESHFIRKDLSTIKPVEIDRDNFDEVIKKLDVRVNLHFQGTGENPLSLHFKELEDFHPDKIFQSLPLFRDLRDIRKRLLNADTFEKAENEVRSWYAEDMETKEMSVDRNQGSPEHPPDDLLEQILFQNDENTADSQSRKAESTELGDFIKKLVRPHLVQVDAAEQSNLLMIVDEVISDLMRKILHHPQFQALESAWRGAYFLVRRVETDGNLKIYILDISKNELTTNLKENSDLEDSYFYKAISENGDTSPGKPWAAVFGNYVFSPNVKDIATLSRIAKISENANTPFISYITPEMFGFESFDESSGSGNWRFSENSSEGKLWTFLRDSIEIAYLGLISLRFLARLPYGDKTEPTEAFSFEEFTATAQHEQYLWSNPVFIGALLLAQTFRQYGWDISQNFIQDIEDLPLYIYWSEDGSGVLPCAETLMTQSNCETLLGQGLIPLISYKDSDRIKVARFQSIAHPSSFVKGKWS